MILIVPIYIYIYNVMNTLIRWFLWAYGGFESNRLGTEFREIRQQIFVL